MTDLNYIKSIEEENEKLRDHIERVEQEKDTLVKERDAMSYHYDRGEVRLVSILLGNKKSGYVTLPVFAHSRQSECVKFINAHYEKYWCYNSVRSEISRVMGIKRANIMYQISFISGAKNKEIDGRMWYDGFRVFEDKNEAMYYDPRKKAFNVTFKPS